MALITIFLLARNRFPNVYAPRANWLRNAFESIELPSSLKFVLTVFHVPEDEVIAKVPGTHPAGSCDRPAADSRPAAVD